MKLLRHGPPGEEKPGLIDAGGRIRDLTGHVSDINGETLAPDRLAALAALDSEALPVVEGAPRLGVPVAGVGKILGVALNFPEKPGEERPDEPRVFVKQTTALNGPDDPVAIPKGSEKTDYEAEVGVVIGRKAQYVDEADALDYVAGYAVLNDVSERAFQAGPTGLWGRGKGCDTFCPLGPWLVTRDEVPDPQNLDVWLEVNGERRQAGNTSAMFFSVAYLISYFSRYMTLLPGDVIASGTPPGVGWKMDPPRFLAPGDVMRLGVAGLGEQRQEVMAWRPSDE